MFDGNDAVRWLINIVIFLSAWQLAATRPEFARQASRTVAALLGLIWGMLVVSGMAHRDPAAKFVVGWHRVLGHVAVIVAWCGTIFAATTVLRQTFPRRPAAAIAQLFLFATTLGGTVLAGISGYLGPSQTNMVGEETYHRFVMLHMYFLPGVVALLLVQWWWYFRPRRERSSS